VLFVFNQIRLLFLHRCSVRSLGYAITLQMAHFERQNQKV
jgi:hypothetical protein